MAAGRVERPLFVGKVIPTQRLGSIRIGGSRRSRKWLRSHPGRVPERRSGAGRFQEWLGRNCGMGGDHSRWVKPARSNEIQPSTVPGYYRGNRGLISILPHPIRFPRVRPDHSSWIGRIPGENGSVPNPRLASIRTEVRSVRRDGSFRTHVTDGSRSAAESIPGSRPPESSRRRRSLADGLVVSVLLMASAPGSGRGVPTAPAAGGSLPVAAVPVQRAPGTDRRPQGRGRLAFDGSAGKRPPQAQPQASVR
jgi:hypothetical protein